MTAVIDLRARAARQPIAVDVGALSPRERAMAIETWRGRMVNEYVSSRVFAALVPQLIAAELDAVIVGDVAAMVAEEIDHGTRCAAVVTALGGEAVAPLPTLADVPDHAEVDALEAALRNLVSIACLSETVAVALLTAERARTEPPPLRATLTAILADEVGHARVGWRALDELGPRLTPALRARLGRYLVPAFQTLRTYELDNLPLGATPSAAAQAVGVCDGREARSIFFRTVETVIVPGLEAHGLTAADAWRQAA